MKKVKSISEVVNAKPPIGLESIKDYATVNKIHKLYMKSEYLRTCRAIQAYDEFIFFHDYCIFLKFELMDDEMQSITYRTLVEIYTAYLFETHG